MHVTGKRKKGILNNERGVAMLIALGIITLVITASLELNRQVRNTMMAVATVRDRTTLSEMAAGGIHAAMAMLARDKQMSRIDSVQEDWADSDKIRELLAEIPYEKGNVKIEITDELGRIQVNALVDFPRGRNFNGAQKTMWDRIVPLIKASHDAFEDLESTEIVNSVKDWLDSGDDDAISGLNGAESDYYESLDPPYKARNAPFVHISELSLVKGITPAFFSGIEGMPGIAEFMTVYGATKAKQPFEKRDFTFEGKVNINTAPLPVIIALVPSENPEYAQSIYDYRQEKEGDEFLHSLNSPTWYKQAPDIPAELTIDPQLITTESDFFRIIATSTLQEMSVTITAVVHREKEKETNKWTCRVLSWETG